MASDTLFIGTRRYSSWSLRGWLAVRLAGLAVAERVLPLAEAGSPAVIAVSPSGQVPYLEHDGNRVWDSLAIAEYCAELNPALWPADRGARSHARVLSAEMHSGFRALRIAMPMNLGRDRPLRDGITAEVQADLDRIERLWSEARADHGAGGPYLFGAGFTVADAMFAPVAARLISYQVALGPVARAYRDAVRAHPLLEEWYRAAADEPAGWRLDKYEDLA